MPSSKSWARGELLLVLNLYDKLTFGQLHSRQRAIMQLAEKMGRSANSVAMKLCNLASLDPEIQSQGKKGLPNASSLDREIWDEFYGAKGELAPESEEALRELFGAGPGGILEVLPEGIRVSERPPMGEVESSASLKARRGEEYFREVVLNNFGGRCVVTGLSVRELLIASHIVPRETHPQEWLNVRNGLCLSQLHDAAFKGRLISFDRDLKLRLSGKLKSELSQKVVAENFGQYEGRRLELPNDALLPEPEFLAIHYAQTFSKS